MLVEQEQPFPYLLLTRSEPKNNGYITVGVKLAQNVQIYMLPLLVFIIMKWNQDSIGSCQ